ncbi:MAG: spore cortex biosynthesis protein YabQ [Oscillospiraceae bacterium]|nr:spore cortex biosynthesis protein YabQ [Oscillospiraceae bacterium]
MNARIPDTFWTTQEELLLFGGACLLGIPAGILFDIWRILRRMWKHPAVLVAVEDVLWILSAGLLLLCYADTFAKGVFRGYYAIGCGIGFVLYECTLGNLLTGFVTGFLRLLGTPVQELCAGFASICRKGAGSFVNSTKKDKKEKEIAQKRLQKPMKWVYNKTRTQKEREHIWQRQND